MTNQKTFKTECNRCGGKGITDFEHVENGTCFKCKGRGIIEVTEKQYKALQEKARKSKENFDRVDVAIFPGSYDTFNDKEIIKSLGFKFDSTFGWHIIKRFANEQEASSYYEVLGNEARSEGLQGIIVTEVQRAEYVITSARLAQKAIKNTLDAKRDSIK